MDVHKLDRGLDTTQQFERLLSAEEAAQLLGGMHIKTLQRMARNCEIPSHRIGRGWFFRASELDEWLRVKSQRQPARSTTKESIQ